MWFHTLPQHYNLTSVSRIEADNNPVNRSRVSSVLAMVNFIDATRLRVAFCQKRNTTIELIQHEYDRGRSDAARDWANGARRMYAPLIGAWGRFTNDLLSHRYNILVKHVSDMTTAEKLSYENGYNSIARDYIAEHDGADAWDRIQDEIRNFREEHYRKHLRTDA